MADFILSETSRGIPASGTAFVENDESEWKTVGQGIRRQILAHGPDLMIVRVTFEPGAIGMLHHHPHRQATYVADGSFEATVGGEKRVLKTGDSFFAASEVSHGVVALESGVLIDCFSPARADFLEVARG